MNPLRAVKNRTAPERRERARPIDPGHSVSPDRGTGIEGNSFMEPLFRTNDPQEARCYFEAKIAFSTGPGEVHAAMERGRRVGVDFNLIDVRAKKDYAAGRLPGATNLPEEEWETFAGLARDKVNLVYCSDGECHLAARAAVVFASAGYSVMEIDGGYRAWAKDRGYAVETSVVPEDGIPAGLKRTSSPPFRNSGRFANESIL